MVNSAPPSPSPNVISKVTPMICTFKPHASRRVSASGKATVSLSSRPLLHEDGVYNNYSCNDIRGQMERTNALKFNNGVPKTRTVRMLLQKQLYSNTTQELTCGTDAKLRFMSTNVKTV
jgi:hypothetical protein